MPALFYPAIQRLPYVVVDARYTEARAIRAEHRAYWAQEAAEDYADAYEYERERRQHAQLRSLRATTAGYRQGYRHAANDMLAEAGRQQQRAFSLGLREGQRRAAEEQQGLGTAAMVDRRDIRLVVNDQQIPSPSCNEAAMEILVMRTTVLAILKTPDQEQVRGRHDNQGAADRSQKAAKHTHIRSCQQECIGRSGTAAPRQCTAVGLEALVEEGAVKERAVKEGVVKEGAIKEVAVKEGAVDEGVDR
ncbi:MAG: hypothetical protein Q9184_003116 [Pyrenodesmia sp. 2 TL-2023]